MDLIQSQKSKIIKFDNIFFPKAESKVFGIAKISNFLAKKLIGLIEKDIKKKKTKKKMF